MKKSLLLFVVSFFCSTPLFGQQDVEKRAANFEFTWTDHLLPNCSFLIFQGKDEAYFIDSLGNRVPNHTYLSIETGGNDHFIVKSKSGFHLLDTKLTFVTDKNYDTIQLYSRSEIKLTLKGVHSYYTWDNESKGYKFTQNPPQIRPQGVFQKDAVNLELGKVNDPRFKAKRIEQLRLGIDMTTTLTVGQKGKNVLVFKGDEIVFKGLEKPMLFYDFMITGEKGPHSIYHPISKEPILENCDRFWCVGSFLVVSVKESLRKHIVSNTGKIILSSAGEIRYYDYELGGTRFSFFCDGRSVVNMNGDVIYNSDGELIGVAEHYIYAGNKGAYLGNLTSKIDMNCTNFIRYGVLTLGQTAKKEWRLYDPKSILVNSIEDFYIDETDSIITCASESKTMVFNAFTGNLLQMFPGAVRGQNMPNENKWKYFSVKKSPSGVYLEGRFDPIHGIVIESKYRKIEWPSSENYYIVLLQDGSIRYLDGNGQELFD